MKETLEEAAERFAYDSTEENKGFPSMKMFIEGAKWKSERMYSEEDILDAWELGAKEGLPLTRKKKEELFEQFKKKESMTPKEKARELVNSFTKYSEGGIDNNVKTLKANAKKCALIAVDEILDILHPNNWQLEIDKYYYWKDVIEEINNL